MTQTSPTPIVEVPKPLSEKERAALRKHCNMHKSSVSKPNYALLMGSYPSNPPGNNNRKRTRGRSYKYVTHTKVEDPKFVAAVSGAQIVTSSVTKKIWGSNSTIGAFLRYARSYRRMAQYR